MLRYTTAGESHGKCLLTTIEGLPYGTPVSLEGVNAELARRQGGYGRGARMKIEKDEAEVITGVRQGHTLGSPVTLQVMNRVSNTEDLAAITRPRPGHADLAGAFAGTFLGLLGIRVLGYVVEVGDISSDARAENPDDLGG